MDERRDERAPVMGVTVSDGISWASKHLHDARKAALTLQKGMRKQRWLRNVRNIGGEGIRLLRHGYCGTTLFPIRSINGALVGYEGRSGRRYSHPAHGWGVLPLDGTMRILCISAVELAVLENMVLAAIIANCLFLAVQGPPDQYEWLPQAEADNLELFFTIFFTLEMMLRIGALGLAGNRHAYLADSWNLLDLSVVISAWVPLLIPQLSNVSGLRAIRALRPLRTINRLPGMRKQVNALLGLLPALGDVMLLLAFFMLVAGVLGVQLFAGTLRRRCSMARGLDIQPEGVCVDDTVCLSSAGHCEWYGKNPRDGTLSFDTILQSWMTLSQVVTLEGWTDVELVLRHVGGAPGSLYVFSIVVIGAFYLLNLLFVVTWENYMSQQAKKPEPVATAARVVLAGPATGSRSSSPSFKNGGVGKGSKAPGPKCEGSRGSGACSCETTGGAASPSKDVAGREEWRAILNGQEHTGSDKGIPGREEWREILNGRDQNGSMTSGKRLCLRVPGNVRANWVQSFLVQDPRMQLARFFRPGDHRGPFGYLQDKGIKPDVNQHSSYFSVWRPTSMDAIRMMMEGRATGKPLTVKGKSAQKGELSGFVPFLQISEEAHKGKVGASPKDARIRVFFQTVEASAAVLSAVQPVLREMVQVSRSAEQQLADEEAGKIVLDDDERDVALQGARWSMEDAKVHPLDAYAKNGAHGLDMPERLFMQVFVWRADISHEKGWETGRNSEPAFMDLNLHATRDVPGPEGPPRAVVWQHDALRPLNPRGLLVALEEKDIERVRPVASDFDAFLVGSRGLTFEPLPPDQVQLVQWLISCIESVLAQSDSDPWMKRWLQVLHREGLKGFHPEIPPYGFGDPTSYSIVQSIVRQVRLSGAVRHGAECFNFYFPQDLDDEYLVVWDGFEAIGSAALTTGHRSVPFRYLDRAGLLSFLSARLDDGFAFPLNPKWLLCDAGWWQLYEQAEQSPASAASLEAWYPSDTGLRKQLRAVHEAYPHGFVREKRESGEGDDTLLDLEVMEFHMRRVLVMRKARIWLRVAVMFYQRLMDVRRRKQWVRYGIVENSIFQTAVTSLVILNMLAMMCEHYPAPEGQAQLIEMANYGFTAAFTLEMALKLGALGSQEYWADTFNRFDGVIVVVSLLEICAQKLNLPLNAQALRALRLLRVFKLLKAWKSLQRLLSSLLRAVQPVAWLLLLFALVLFIFALLGMQFFGNRLELDEMGAPPRPHFDSIGYAMLAVTIVATKEDWNELWRSVNHTVGPVSSLYFIALIVLGAYLLYYLVVTTLIGSFDATPEDSEDKEENTSPADHVTSSKDHYALGCLLPSHPLRLFATSLISERYHVGTHVTLSFDSIILVLIIVSSGAVALQSCELDDSSALFAVVEWVDLGSTVVFTFELAIKVVALGLLPYLGSRWHQLDAFVVTTSVLSIFAGSSPAFRVLRVLRVLRPLRLLSMIPSMKQVTTLLLNAAPRVLDVGMVYLLFLAIFSVLGVQLFGGHLSSCTLETGHMSRRACEEAGGEWLPPAFGSFDNVGAAALLLFEVSTLEGWTVVMFACVDAVGVDAAPTRDANPAMALFVIAWVVTGAMCLVNLFVGVLVKTLDSMRKQEEKATYATANQKQWAQAMEAMLALRPKRQAPLPNADWRIRCHAMATSPRFELAILLVIVFNTLLMALDGYGNSEVMETRLAQLNTACTMLFILEAAIKIGAFRFHEYIREPWHMFDFSIVLLSIADWVLQLLAAAVGTNPTLARVLRIARVTRLMRTFRLIKSARGLQVLLSMLLLSLPALATIFSLFLILLAMYALLGMQLFGGVSDGVLVGDEVTFCTFPSAMLALFRCATGEGWNIIMHDLMYDDTKRAPDGAACNPDGGSCGSWLAIPYFVSFMVLSAFVVLKMLIAVILEKYMDVVRRNAQVLQVEHKDPFLDVWSRFDTLATGWLPVGRLPELVHSLPPPLGLDPGDYPYHVVPRPYVMSYLVQSHLRCHRPRAGSGAPEVHFAQVLAGLAKDAYRHDHARWLPKLGTKRSHEWADVLPSEKSNIGQQLRASLAQHRISVDNSDDEDKDSATVGMPVGEHLAASLVQERWALFRASKERMKLNQGPFDVVDSKARDGQQEGGQVKPVEFHRWGNVSEAGAARLDAALNAFRELLSNCFARATQDPDQDLRIRLNSGATNLLDKLLGTRPSPRAMRHTMCSNATSLNPLDSFHTRPHSTLELRRLPGADGVKLLANARTPREQRSARRMDTDTDEYVGRHGPISNRNGSAESVDLHQRDLLSDALAASRAERMRTKALRRSLTGNAASTNWSSATAARHTMLRVLSDTLDASRAERLRRKEGKIIL